ncbi:amidohydrolase [Agromyces seonyuensis]|uniref:Amidohydrolase family protein n=1 Tax=Agromyces seonyuensis TaxID=2662446 RepID=A0A6I4NZG4_9MICO|nr:amidohydrolase [Agromyces seonyuensis]MWB97149.1 amidohydrolase family protein [Agromyces seonyuensis]
MSEVVIYPARLVRTMDAAVPTAEAVAVRGDRILAVGDVDVLASTYPGASVDSRYAELVLAPGFVEAHSHIGGEFMNHPQYLGYFPRTAPDGTPLPGAQTWQGVLDALRVWDAELPAGEVLLARGLDLLFFPGEELTRHVLDSISTTRGIFVNHASGHVGTANSFLLERAGYGAGTEIEGVVLDADGLPTGELQEMHAMGPVMAHAGIDLAAGLTTEAGMYAFAADARNHGVTTATDLASFDLVRPGGADLLVDVTSREDFALRLVPATFGGMTTSLEEARQLAGVVAASQHRATAKLHLGTVKLMLDGSIQQHTAKLSNPGYVCGHDNGIWNTDAETFRDQVRAFHAAGLNIHVHCNGDEATEVFLDAVETVLSETPRWNHRHTVTHSQLTTRAQYRRMAELGMGANIFSNHIWYWGDQHIDSTVGPDRVKRMNAARTALDAGVKVALHCDTPVTPLDPMATASYAAERRTPTGRSWGDEERISVYEALEAVTIGPAYLLKLDHLVGSIVPGKFADFAVLERDPLDVAEAKELREIGVLGTVVGGIHHPAPIAARV